MLPKKHRLNLSLEKNTLLFKRNQSFFINSTSFLVYIRKNDEFLKFTCVAPRRKYPKATTRNFYKRQIFSALENLIIAEKIDKNKKIDIVLVLKNIEKEQLSQVNIQREIIQGIAQFKFQ